MTHPRIALYLTAVFAASFSTAAWAAAGAPSLGAMLGGLEGESPASDADPSASGPQANDEASSAAPGVDPFELAEAIVEARGRYAESDDDIALAATRARYVGREVTWEVRYVSPFCTAPDRCAVLAFDHARSSERVLAGWMPRLALGDEEHRQLRERCAPHERCVVTLHGELSELELSPGEPTSVTLSDVRIVSARAERADESFIRRRSPNG